MSTTLSTLNDLIETLKDGQNGFRAASEDVQSPELKSLFREYSLQRSRFAGDLQALAHSLGEADPETSGSLSGALHRGWIDLKSALSNQDEHAVLAECERGEDSAVDSYEKALENPQLPRHVAETLHTQLNAIKSAHDRIRDLRDAMVTK